MNDNVNINTNYQNGDNNVFIKNSGKQPRIINDLIGKQLEENLDRTKKIIITSILGDSEAFSFATQIKTYLQKNDYNIDGINQAVYSVPVLG